MLSAERREPSNKVPAGHCLCLAALFLISACFCAGPVSAAAPGSPRTASNPPAAPSSGSSSILTLDQALATALQTNPSLKRVESTHESARQGVNQAISAFLPKLNLDMTLGRSNNPVFAFGSKLNQSHFTMQDFQLEKLNNPDYRTNWNTRFVLVQPIFNRGREYVGYRISRAGENMAALQELAVTQVVLFNVKQAYLQALLAKEATRVMESAVETAARHEQLATERYQAGLVLKSDVLSAVLQRTQMERELLSAQNQAMIALAGLNRAMGTPQDTAWKLEPVTEAMSPGDESVDAWIQKARENRPELNMTRTKVKIAEYKKSGAQLNFLPAVNFNGIYEQNTDNPGKFGGDSWTFMATASFNLFNGLGDRARLKAADAEARAAEEELNETRSRIELEVRQAFYSWKTAIKQQEVTSAAVKQAEESVTILKNRYDNGMALMVELLAADTMLKTQKLNQAQARFDTMVALARLELSAGVLGATRPLPQSGKQGGRVTATQVTANSTEGKQE